MSKLREFLKNITYSLIANALNLIVSTASSVLIPVVLGEKIDQYGYFQIYLFYIAYVGFFHFGLCDGALLQEGGKKYSDIDKSEYSFQFLFLTAGEFLISLGIVFMTVIISHETDYCFIAVSFGLNLLLYLPRNLLEYLLQASNRIKENAMITIIGRSIYLVCILILWAMRYQSYYLFVGADIVGKMCALIYVIFQCRDLVFTKPVPWTIGIHGVAQNISAGIKLMVAGISSMLITGMTRFAIQQEWDVTTYGKVSLTLSITNLVLSFISAMAIVLYPTLKRVSTKRAVSLYCSIRDILMTVLLGTLIFCYPLQLIMCRILPQYSDSLAYMPILFPVCIFSAKVTMLIQTYMQVFRMEGEVLKVNLLSVVIALINTIVSVFIFHNLTIAVFSILITSVFRSTLAELVLSKRLGLNILKDSVVEVIYVLFFVAVSCLAGGKQGMWLYIPIFLIFAGIKVKSINEGRKLIQKEK